MNIADFADVVECEGQRLFDVAATDFHARVPNCPDWDMTDLVGHVGQVYGYVASLVASPSTDRPTSRFSDFEPGGEIVAWGKEKLESLVAVCRAAVPGTPCWNWGDGDTIEFFPRRMAHETVIHRRDAEEAVGDITPLDSDVAADGVDELIYVGLQHSLNPKRIFDYPNGSLHLHRTDGEGEWLLKVEDGRLIATREHAKGDVAVRGTGSDLFLYLWGRGGADLDIFGDPGLAEQWARVSP